MDVREAGRVTEVSFVQFSNAWSPMASTPSGMETEVRPEQPENALCPMDVRESGRVTEARPEQPENALSPMISTRPGTVSVPSSGGMRQASSFVPPSPSRSPSWKEQAAFPEATSNVLRAGQL